LTGTTAPLTKITWLAPPNFSLSPNFTRHCSRQRLLQSLTQRGPLLITQQGISGPAILKLSAFGAEIFANLNYR
jgi:predicted flavoprotein YhiN